MRFVIQRVNMAEVRVDGEIKGSIGKGIMVLAGFIPSDDAAVMDYMLQKVINLRIFEDENDKMNLSLLDISGELLIVPNFTLYGDARKGRRPGFSNAASPAEAEIIFEKLKAEAKKLDVNTEFGVFQAYMQVKLENDGPVTLLLDSDRLF